MCHNTPSSGKRNFASSAGHPLKEEKVVSGRFQSLAFPLPAFSKLMHRLLFLALFLCFNGLACAEDTVQALPDDAIQAYLQSVKVPAITVNADTRFRKDFEARWFKWCQRVILNPFATRLTCDAATKEKTLHVATEGILLWRGGRQQDPAFDMRTLGDKCAELVAAGVDDPVICWLQSWATHEYARDFPSSEKIFKHGLDHKGKMPSLKVLMISTFIHIIYDSRQWVNPADYHAQLVDTAKRSLKQGEYCPMRMTSWWPIFTMCSASPW
jgi:hypothetical protein